MWLLGSRLSPGLHGLAFLCTLVPPPRVCPGGRGGPPSGTALLSFADTICGQSVLGMWNFHLVTVTLGVRCL